MESALRQPGMTSARASSNRIRSGLGGCALGLLALFAAGSSLSAHAAQDGLLQGQLLDPAAALPRATLPPRLREPQLSPSDAARQVQRRYGGRVLSVQPQAGGGYRIKLLKDGEVRTYDINP
jgi:hypothetical protein